MKNGLRTMLTALTLLSRVPVPFKFLPRYRGVLFVMPLAGFLVLPIPLLLIPLFRFLEAPSFVTAGAVLAVSYACFNLFHFDGLLDTADAFLLNAGRERRMAILKDSAVGSFAFFSGTLYLILKFALLAYFAGIFSHPGSGLRLLALVSVYPVAGRAAAALIPLLLRPARSDGLGVLMGESSRWEGTLGLVFSSSLIGTAWHFLFTASPSVLLYGGSSFLAAVAVSWLWCTAVYRKIGGYTGDAFGCTVELGELLFLLFLTLTPLF